MNTSTPRHTILIADDDAGTRALLELWLEPTGHKLFFAAKGAEVLPLAEQCHPDCIILDFELGDQTALEVCQNLQSNARLDPVPRIIFTSHFEEKLHAYRNCGADHFVLKEGGDAEELLAILEATFRRVAKDREGCADAALVERGRIRVDVTRKKVWASGEPRHLQPKCFDLLCVLLRYPGGASKDLLLDAVWGGEPEPNTLSKTIQRLRQDLDLQGDDPIVSGHGGYQLVG
ncbi:MAG: response regulator transcription factor [Elusimicrobiota bacterium]|jgi:DNA-binding response OmpR family regulator